MMVSMLMRQTDGLTSDHYIMLSTMDEASIKMTWKLISFYQRDAMLVWYML